MISIVSAVYMLASSQACLSFSPEGWIPYQRLNEYDREFYSTEQFYSDVIGDADINRIEMWAGEDTAMILFYHDDCLLVKEEIGKSKP